MYADTSQSTVQLRSNRNQDTQGFMGNQRCLQCQNFSQEGWAYYRPEAVKSHAEELNWWLPAGFVPKSPTWNLPSRVRTTEQFRFNRVQLVRQPVEDPQDIQYHSTPRPPWDYRPEVEQPLDGLSWCLPRGFVGPNHSGNRPFHNQYHGNTSNNNNGSGGMYDCVEIGWCKPTIDYRSPPPIKAKPPPKCLSPEELEGTGWGYCPPCGVDPRSLIRPRDKNLPASAVSTKVPFFVQTDRIPLPQEYIPKVRKDMRFDFCDWLATEEDRQPPEELRGGLCIPTLCTWCEPAYVDCCRDYQHPGSYVLVKREARC